MWRGSSLRSDGSANDFIKHMEKMNAIIDDRQHFANQSLYLLHQPSPSDPELADDVYNVQNDRNV